MFKTFAPKHSCRLTFQFQGISVQFSAIYHVKRINKKENGSTFTLAKAFPFRWEKKLLNEKYKKDDFGASKTEKLLKSPS